MAVKEERRAEDGIGELLGSVGHLVRRATQHYTAVWSITLPTNVTPAQLSVLVALASAPEAIDQQTLGETVRFDKSTCGTLVDRLRVRGLLCAETDPDNRRRKLLTPTDAGRRAAAEGLAGMRAVERAAQQRLTSSERETLGTLLTKLVGDT